MVKAVFVVNETLIVTPAKAGAHVDPAVSVESWVPAFAEMTIGVNATLL
jgi:hypothetical protein